VPAQQLTDLAQHARTLERGNGAPLEEAAPGRGDGGVDVRCVADGDASERFARARIRGLRESPGHRLVPGAAEVDAAVIGQSGRG
jgi:hypothetical protein